MARPAVEGDSGRTLCTSATASRGSAPDPLILTADDLIAITRRTRPSGQRRVLDALDIPYRVHPFDGTLIVARAAVETMLGVQPGPEPEPVYEVNVEAIRNHGKASASR